MWRGRNTVMGFYIGMDIRKKCVLEGEMKGWKENCKFVGEK
jgi:hypothetical protein